MLSFAMIQSNLRPFVPVLYKFIHFGNTYRTFGISFFFCVFPVLLCAIANSLESKPLKA